MLYNAWPLFDSLFFFLPGSDTKGEKITPESGVGWKWTFNRSPKTRGRPLRNEKRACSEFFHAPCFFFPFRVLSFSHARFRQGSRIFSWFRSELHFHSALPTRKSRFIDEPAIEFTIFPVTLLTRVFFKGNNVCLGKLLFPKIPERCKLFNIPRWKFALFPGNFPTNAITLFDQETATVNAATVKTAMIIWIWNAGRSYSALCHYHNWG